MRTVVGLLVAGLLAGCGGSGSTARSTSGTGRVAGRVLSAPGCPVERADTPCPPRTVPGAAVTAYDGSDRVAQVRTNSAGRFELRISPGSYTLTVTNAGGYRSTAKAVVVVRRDSTVSVTLTVDSGIR